MPKSKADYQREIRAKRRTAGLCEKCGKPPAPGFKSCRTCLDRACEKVKEYHARHKLDPSYLERYRLIHRDSARRMRADPVKRVKDNARSRAQARARRDMIQRIKLERGCADCGYREHGEALDFDHLDPKEKKSIVSRIKTLSLESLMAEIAKCEVVCANCHRVRSFNRRRAQAAG